MMIDFALEAEREEGKPPREAIYQACLLRFRPIMMTTMAALLGGVPLALGTGYGLGAAAAAGHHDRRRADLQPGADAVHHAGDLPVVRPAGARWLRGGAATNGRQLDLAEERMNISAPFIRAAGGDHAADRRDRAGGRGRVPACCRFRRCRRWISRPSRVSRRPAGRESGDHGVVGGDAAGAPVRTHRRRDRDDVDQLPRLDAASRCSSI